MGVQISGDTGNVLATKGTYTGNLTVGGVLTYEDVTNVDSVGLVTARSGIEIGARPGVAASISVDGNMIVSGISTFNGDVKLDGGNIVFGDSGGATDDRLTFGAGTDLSIYHNGNESKIEETGTGGLRINTSVLNINNGDQSETMGKFTADGTVELYHNNVKTFEPTSNGIRIVADEGNYAYLYIDSDQGDDNADKWRWEVGNGGAHILSNYASGSWEKSIECNGNGNVELYNDNT